MKIIKLAVLVLGFMSCNMNVGSNKDGSKGILVEENGLKAGKVYITDGSEEVGERSFFYGQKIYTNFSDLEGFNLEDGKYYPEMEMYLLTQSGDTIMRNANLFSNTNTGFDASVPIINGHVVLAKPIYSNKKYVIHYTIKDAKGDASLSSKMDFEVVANPYIKIKTNGLAYSEAYVYSEDRETVLQEGKANFYENLRFDIQDLSGYKKVDGGIHLGMDVVVLDNDGNEILNLKDLFKEPIYDEALLKQGISATLKINKGSLSNPVNWRLKIRDKNSTAKLIAEAKIIVE